MADEPALILNLTDNEADVDWMRAARLKEKCEKGDQIACEQLRDMEESKLWPHDELAASKDTKDAD